jgi:hypothetical protein
MEANSPSVVDVSDADDSSRLSSSAAAATALIRSQLKAGSQ